VRAGGRPSRLGADGVRRIGETYRATAADLALARRRFPGDAVIGRLEQLVARSRPVVYHAPTSRTGVVAFFTTRYWQRVRERKGDEILGDLLIGYKMVRERFTSRVVLYRPDRIDVSYSVPFTSPGKFEGRVLYKGGPTRLVAPNGVTVKGDDIRALGQEPRTQASIYDVKGDSFKVEIAGSGTLRPSEDSGEDSGGATIEQIPPKLYDNMKWILALAFGILTLGFILLYRAHAPVTALATPSGRPRSPVKDKNERRRR